MSKKKDQDKFIDYINNTRDAWETDDRKITRKIVENTRDQTVFPPEELKQTEPVEEKSKKLSPQISSISASDSKRRSPFSNLKSLIENPKSKENPINDVDLQRDKKFKQIFDQQSVDLNELRKICWSGIPQRHRAQSWKLLCGYLPAKVDRREEILNRKRDEYWSYVDQYFPTRTEIEHLETFRQIQRDIPRMVPVLSIFDQIPVQQIFERILFIWAIRHPACGYVQGMNDLATPFFLVFLLDLIDRDVDLSNFELDSLSELNRRLIEADSFWATCYLLESIQNNYIFAQPGIQCNLRTLEDLMKRVDDSLFRHLKRHNIEFFQFAFRWMHNLLMREFPIRCTIRLWDTYLSEQNGFSQFHLYICAALLIRFSKDLLKQNDFQSLLLFLQNLPTQSWTSNDISILTAEAFKLSEMFANAPRHLNNN